MRPDPPDWLDAAAREMWDRLVKQVAASEAARRDLAAYCLAHGWWQRTLETVAQLGADDRQVCHSNGEARPHPAVLLEQVLAGELFALAASLGLEPTGRPQRRPTTILFLDEGAQS